MATANSHGSILIVDDSAEICEFYTLILQQAGYRIAVAHSGAEGLVSAHDQRPDLLLVDVVMPGMDGLEMLMHLRSDLAPPLPPAIVCSGFDITEAEARRRGAIGFLPKPIAPDILLETVRAVMAGGTPEAGLQARSRCMATEARRGTALTAEALFATLNGSGVGNGVLDALSESLDWLRHYFHFDSALVVGLRSARLKIGASTGHARFQPGMDVEEMLPPCRAVVDTGSSLVIVNSAAHPCFSTHQQMAKKFGAFAGVPLKAPGSVTVGALCLADSGPHAFEAEDLCILEQLGRRGSQVLHSGSSGLSRGSALLDEAPGILIPETFRLVLAMELRLAHRHSHALEVVMVEVDPALSGHALWKALCAKVDFERLAVGVDGTHRIVSFKRAPSQAEASLQIQKVVEALHETTAVRGAGAVSCAGDHLPEMSEQEWLHMAEALLAEALGKQSGDIERIVLRREAWPSPDPGTIQTG